MGPTGNEVVRHASTIVDPGDDLIGRVLGDFVLRELIGEGSFGRVFRAEQPVLEREAVVKVARAGGRDPAAIHRFLAEARLASRLDHPFAAHIYAFGAEPDGTLWIAMELIRGTPLSALIAHGALPPERAIPLMRRLCEVVHTAHELGVVHRDLKPDNVMIVARAGNLFPKLLDLGIARDLRIDPVRSTAAGTPLYMAPELWVTADRAGPPADVYALAAITFELLTGAPPFAGRSVMEIAAKHARTPPPTLPGQLPAALSAAIAKGLAKRVADRYPSALAFADALIDSTGVAIDAVNLPQLEDLTRDEALASAPRPIAEAVAGLDAATSPARAHAAVAAIADAISRLAAVIALAARDRIGTGGHADAPAVVELLVTLRERPLVAREWWRLTRELCRPFAELRDVHPIPELVAVFFDGRAEVKTALDALFAANPPGANAAPEAVHGYLVGAVPLIATALRTVGFLADYRLVVPVEDAGATTGEVEVWNGVRRPEAVRIAASAATAAITGAAVVDAAGTVAVTLAPYAQVAAPAAGAARELFLVEGPSRTGARLRALPGPLELKAEGIGVIADDRALAADAVPYRGLSTFTEADAGLFFGREREVDELVNRLRTMPWIAVVGPSGSGKSSFVQAGVLPALAGGEHTVTVRPGPTPLATLVARVTAAYDGIELDADALRADPARFGAALRDWARDRDRKVVVVVDQFEELFTLCFDAAEHDVYADALHRAARVGDPLVRVIVTVRDDFLIRAAALPALRPTLAARLQLVTTPAAPDLMRILLEPARRAGFAFEDDALPREMVDEVATHPGALALLSFTASKLWQVRDRAYHRLSRAAYRAIGGVGGALAQHAESVLEDIDEDRRPIVREMFRHLVTADGTRAVMSRADLLQVAGGDRAEPALEAMINARLLVAMDSEDGERIEVVHETLLSAWPRLVAWRQQDAENARLRDQLRAAARQWEDRGRPRGLLWRGEALTEYRLWRARYPGGLTAREDAFGAASIVDETRSRRLRRAALGTVMTGLVIALIVFARLRSTALASERDARASRVRAEASEATTAQSLTESYVDQGRRALLAGNPSEALTYLAAARSRGHDSPAARFMIARALEPLTAMGVVLDHGGAVTAVRYTPDGAYVVTAGNGEVATWTPDGHQVARVDAEPSGTAIVLAVDGHHVITGAAAGSIQVWDLPGLGHVATLAGGTGVIDALALSADGTRLVSSAFNGEIRVWSALTADAAPVVLAPPFKPARALARPSPAFDRIAIAYLDPQATDGIDMMWTPGRAPVALAGSHGGRTPAWTTDGRRVATPGFDGVTRVYTAATGALVATLVGGDTRVYTTAFTDDGTTLATAGEDGAVKLWDVDRGALLASLRAHTGTVSSIAFFAGSRSLAAIGSDGRLTLWDVPHRRLINSHIHGGFLSSLAIAPGGDRIATASWSGTVRLWATQSPSDLVVLGGGDDRSGLASSDGRYVIRTGPRDSLVWRTADLHQVTIAAAGAVLATESSHDLLAIADHREVRVAELATGDIVASWTAAADVVALAIEPGGARVAVATSDGALAVVERATGGETARRDTGVASAVEWAAGFLVVGSGGQITALRATDLTVIGQRPTSSPDWLVRSLDGAHVATAATYSVVDVWGATGPVATLSQRTRISTMEWTPELLAVGGNDGSVQLWSRTDWSSQGAFQANDQATRALAASGGLIASLGALDVVRVWDLATRRPIYETRLGRGAIAMWFGADRIVAMSPDGAFDIAHADLATTTPAELAQTASCRDSGALAHTLGLPPCAR